MLLGLVLCDSHVLATFTLTASISESLTAFSLKLALLCKVMTPYLRSTWKEASNYFDDFVQTAWPSFQPSSIYFLSPPFFFPLSHLSYKQLQFEYLNV